MPDVQGRCPACGAASLFLGEGGHVTCARIECPNPCAADDMLHGEAATPRRAGDALGCRIPETLTKGISRDDYALAPSASEPPVVAAARIQLNAAPASDTVPVPPGAFDRLVRVAMWVSRGRSMAHTPDPQISGSYPDTAARFALGALDDAGSSTPTGRRPPAAPPTRTALPTATTRSSPKAGDTATAAAPGGRGGPPRTRTTALAPT
ncbi:hypothetical protein DDE05_50525 [Streptomyces cavourensis]|nr:hypothetical protein DDE05_50525 [Streptomyces cavourensis]